MDVEPELNVTETTHYKVTVEESRELRRESINEKPTRSAMTELNLTVKPVGDEVHFIWSVPKVEAMPVTYRNDKIEYLIARFGGMWSPSFAVDPDGKFLRVLEQDVVVAGYEALKFRAREDTRNPDILKQLESVEPMDIVTETAVQRWNEMGGAFLPYRFAYNTPIEVELGKLTALEQKSCTTGQCWKFRAETDASRSELAETRELLNQMDAQILEARRELVTHSDVATMLPTRTRLEFNVTLKMKNEEGEEEKGGVIKTETVLYQKVSDAPIRAGLTEFPSFDVPEANTKPDAVEQDAGAP
jgi:hypothetical protein